MTMRKGDEILGIRFLGREWKRGEGRRGRGGDGEAELDDKPGDTTQSTAGARGGGIPAGESVDAVERVAESLAESDD